MIKTTPERAKQRIEDLKLKLAKSISAVGDANELLKFECTENEWNDEVCYNIEEGLQKLGFALATLTLWYEEDKDTK